VNTEILNLNSVGKCPYDANAPRLFKAANPHRFKSGEAVHGVLPQHFHWPDVLSQCLPNCSTVESSGAASALLPGAITACTACTAKNYYRTGSR
jgi:hypothetical protein